jgi:adenylate cyclase
MVQPDEKSPQKLFTERLDVDPALRDAVAALPSNDTILAKALRRVPSVIGRAANDKESRQAGEIAQTPVVIAGARPEPYLGKQAYTGELLNIPEIEAAARGHGYLNDSRERDGTVRSVPIVLTVRGKLSPSMALELLRVKAGERYYQIHTDRDGITGVRVGDFFAPTEKDGRIRIYFSPAHAQRRVSAVKLLNGALPRGDLAGQIGRGRSGADGGGRTDGWRRDSSPNR